MMRLAPLSLLLFLGVVPTLFGDEGRDVAYCTDAGLGVFRLRDGSPTKTALAGSTLNETEATETFDEARPSDYEYAYDTRTVVGPDGRVRPRCVAPDFDANAARQCLRGRRVHVVGNSVWRGTAFALRELLVHGNHRGAATGNASGTPWSWVPPRETQKKLCPKEQNNDTNLDHFTYSCRMRLPRLDVEIEFSWDDGIIEKHLRELKTGVPPPKSAPDGTRLPRHRPRDAAYDAIVVGLNPFGALKIYGGQQSFRTSCCFHPSTTPADIAAAAHHLLETNRSASRPPPRIIFAGPTAINYERHTIFPRSELNDELQQLAGIYRDSVTAALMAELPAASLAVRDGAADVAYWDNWALTNAGAAMARVFHFRKTPIKYKEIQPLFHGHPTFERVFEPGWHKGTDGWYDDAMHPAADLQMQIVNQLLAHLCPHGHFRASGVLGGEARA